MKKISVFLGLALAASLATTAALAQHGEPPAEHAPAAATATGHEAAPHGEGHAAPDRTGHTATDPSGTESAVVHTGAHGEAPGGHQGGHGEAHGGHHGPEAMNWTDLSDKSRPAYIGLLVNFGILVALYYTLGKKPVAEGLKQRRLNVGKDIEEARKMLAEAKGRAEKYQADLKNADADAATARESLVQAGKGELERIVGEATERADRMERDAERLVQQEKKQLQRDLLVETIDRAVDEAQKILEKSTTAEDHARLANELLAELAKKPAAVRAAPAVRTGGVS